MKTVTMIFKYKDSAIQIDLEIEDGMGSDYFQINKSLQTNASEIARQIDEMIEST